jgi:hypothetical protein
VTVEVANPQAGAKQGVVLLLAAVMPTMALPARFQNDLFDKVFLANRRSHNAAIRLVGLSLPQQNMIPLVIGDMPVDVEPVESQVQ